MLRPALIVFVKAPRLGTVKTRLASAIGPEAASEVYQCLVRALFRKLNGLHSVQIHFSPADATDEIRMLAEEHWALHPQDCASLGARMQNAFLHAFSSRFAPVVIIGSDCPEIEPEDIHAAWSSLNSHDVVIGPARDGGYWLIGLRAPQPALFEGIHWSTPAVLEETVRKAGALGLSIRFLRELTDIDTPEDWLAWKTQASA
jgi:uncharacterized protein